MAKAKKKAKRYSTAQKKEILDFIKNEGRGGQTKAVSKYKVTAATIASWKKKEGGTVSSSTGTGKSKELRAIEELASVLKEITVTEAHLAKLQKTYQKIKAKI